MLGIASELRMRGVEVISIVDLEQIEGTEAELENHRQRGEVLLQDFLRRVYGDHVRLLRSLGRKDEAEKWVCRLTAMMDIYTSPLDPQTAQISAPDAP